MTATSSETNATLLYRDPNADRDDRVTDLMSRMSLADKAGLLFQTKVAVGDLMSNATRSSWPASSRPSSTSTDRPAVLTRLADTAAALLVSWGSTDTAFLDIVFGRSQPHGPLPFDLPRSMDAVRNSREDMPFDTTEPAFRFGHGLQLGQKANQPPV